MSETTRVDSDLEIKKEEVEKKEEVVVDKQPDKWETKAIESGWQSKEDWVAAGKTEEDWRPAREYVERGELFDKIDIQTKELKQLRKVLDTLKDHHLKVKQQAMEEAISALKSERSKAKADEDLGRVIEITEEIDNLKTKQIKEIEKAKEELNVPQETISSAFKEWHRRNDWYKVNGRDPMSVFANAEADAFIADNRGKVSEAEIFAHVEKKVKEEFPDRFKKVTHDPKVESNSGSRGSSTKKAEASLTEQEEKIMKTLVKSGVLTEEQYLKDLKKFEGKQ